MTVVTSENPVTVPPAAKIEKPRLEWVDYTKGLAIILVTFGHMLGGVNRAGVPHGEWAIHLVDWLYLFHVPVFFVLSGLFVDRSLQKGTKTFVVEKLSQLVYPYVIWTLIQWGAHMLAGAEANSKPDPLAPLKIIWLPYMNYWFLQALFYTFTAYALARAAGLGHRAYLALSVNAFIVIASIHVYLDWTSTTPTVTSTHPILATWTRIAASNLHFAIGVNVAGWMRERLSRLPTWVLVNAVIAFVPMTYIFLYDLRAHPDNVTNIMWFYKPILAWMGVIGLVGLCVLLARYIKMNWLIAVGQYSMAIYLAHNLIGNVARTVLRKFHFDDRLMHLSDAKHWNLSPALAAWIEAGGIVLAATFLGIVLSILLAWGGRKIGFPYLFELPTKKRKTITATAG